MTSLNTMLEEMQHIGACDETTTQKLSIQDPFIEQTIGHIHNILIAGKRKPGRNGEIYGEPVVESITDSEKYVAGGKLLFLEELVQEDETVRRQVQEWLSDERRMLLFNMSPLGDLYGNLLIARAKGQLKEFREKYNKDIPAQQSYSFEKTISVKPDIEKDILAPLKEKLEAICARITKRKMKQIDEIRYIFNPENIEKNKKLIIATLMTASSYNINPLDESSSFDEEDLSYIDKGDAERILNSIDTSLTTRKKAPPEIKLRDMCSKGKTLFDEIIEGIEKAYIGNYTERDIKEQIEEKIFSIEKARMGRTEKGKTRPMTEKEASEEAFLFLKNIIEKYDANVYSPLLENLKKEIITECGHEEIPEHLTEFFEIQKEEMTELLHIQREARLFQSDATISEKVRKAKTLTYSFELSEKDPLDITIGNDSGCCLGIFKDDIGNAYGIPHNIADNATYFFNVYQQINNGKKRRVGMVLAFSTLDEHDNKIILCNSLELSPLMNPVSIVYEVTGFIEEGIIDFGRKNGFAAGAMSAHDYNTSRNYSTKKNNIFLAQFLRKIKTKNEPDFYNEVFDDGGMVRGRRQFYTLYNNKEE